MDSKCLSSMLLLLVFWIIAIFPYNTEGQIAKPGCSDTCGNVRIPYPFGIGLDCAVNQSYTIVCNSSKPYLSGLNLEVLNVSLAGQTVTVNSPINYSCTSSTAQTGAVTSWNSSNLAGTPFFFSKFYNKMMLFGCGHAVLSQNNVLTGCTSTCVINSWKVNTSCNQGIHCCQATYIPFYLTNYQLNFTVSRYNTRNCSTAFLADIRWLHPENFSELSLQNVPVVLAWTIQKNDVDAIYACYGAMRNLELESGQEVRSFACSTCRYFEFQTINPYLRDECRERRPDMRVRSAIIGAGTSIGALCWELNRHKQRKIKNLIP